MDFGGDDRGVTVQIGAVLLFGFLVVSMSLYQATVVPQENERVEFNHNQRAVSDMQEVRNAVVRAGTTGESAPVTVELGTRYRARAMFVNPSPPGGTLSTSPLGEVSIRNAAVDDATTAESDYPDIADFWNETRRYPTNSLTYRPSYNRFRDAPTTVYENGVLYNRFDRGNETVTLAKTGQTLVSGERISVVTLTGNLSRGGSRTLSVDPETVSQSSRTISVTNESAGPLTVVVPTGLSANDWRELLRDSGQMRGDGGRVLNVSAGPSTGTVEITLEPGVTYQLSLSRVRVGAGSERPEARYLTNVETLEPTLRVGESDAFVVEARDEYNNPVGATVNWSVEGGVIDGPVTVAPGRYRFVYTPSDETTTDEVRLSLDDPTDAEFDARDPRDVRVEVDIASGGGDGDGGGDDGGNVDDPGFAYNDVDGDGSYDSTQDAKIPESELADGQYDAGNDQLVIPASSSDISADSIDFQGGQGVYLAPDVTATAGGATGKITIDGGDGDVIVAGATLTANGDNADASLSANGNIDVRDSTIAGHGDVRLSATGWVNASGATLHADKDQSDVILESSGDDIDLTGAVLKATRKDQSNTSPQNDVIARVPNDPSQYTVFVDGATFVDEDDSLDVSPDGAESGTPASGGVV
ncbi:hypothetical protein NDI76_11715 [Halogeometricum sp. S1BR25-6]|uniref:Uncharacterized protein n=1 Tax=Halogeometricum salsisoli TaxID=2950536 RepID=A0ABU2GGX9_9EURY|nr:hypothetical protein [Halogeometricum sp. S1BR25-6]MDS0299409.1 hypothetical protein [Halogeometricum sp. S1BR25-6]